MSFLVLVQGYELVGEPGIGVGAKGGVALLVGVVTVGMVYGFAGRLGAAEAGGGRMEEASEGADRDEANGGTENGKGRV